jgi:hypothetical protein
METLSCTCKQKASIYRKHPDRKPEISISSMGKLGSERMTEENKETQAQKQKKSKAKDTNNSELLVLKTGYSQHASLSD